MYNPLDMHVEEPIPSIYLEPFEEGRDAFEELTNADIDPADLLDGRDEKRHSIEAEIDWPEYLEESVKKRRRPMAEGQLTGEP